MAQSVAAWTLELSGWLSTSFNAQHLRLFQVWGMCSSSRSCMRGLAAILSSRGPESLETAKVTSGASLRRWRVLAILHRPSILFGWLLIGTDAALFGTCPGPVVFARGRNIFGLIASYCTQARNFRRLECLNCQVAGKLLRSLSFRLIQYGYGLALTSLGWIATWAVQVAVARWTCDVYTGWPWAKNQHVNPTCSWSTSPLWLPRG